MTRVLVLLIGVSLTGCAALPAPTGPVTGRWGGEHVGLTLDATGGTVEYDCAAGRIDEPIVPDTNGGFNAGGSHTPNTGGPERVGEPRPNYPARYTGTVSGDTMRLQVTLPGRDLEMPPLVLRRGVEPQLTRCL
ncbi:MAG TPA: hypothetical protein VFS87_07690 [Qipengyuania sp.]|nr:hypothetical protein [Qipengyuania sp.]